MKTCSLDVHRDTKRYEYQIDIVKEGYNLSSSIKNFDKLLKKVNTQVII